MEKGLVIGLLGLFGNVFLIFLIKTIGFVFGQNTSYFFEPNISRRFNLKKKIFKLIKQISVKDIILQMYYASFYGNFFASILLIIGTKKVTFFV